MKDEVKKDDLAKENIMNKGNGNNFYKKIWFWILVVIAIGGVAGTAVYAQHKEKNEQTQLIKQLEVQGQSNNSTTNNGNSVSSSSFSQSINGQSQSVTIESDGTILQENPNADNSTAKEVDLKTGAYEVGKDIMPGYYEVAATGTGKIDVYDNAGNEMLNATIKEGDKTGVATIKMQLNKGEKVDLQGFQGVKFTPYTHKYLSTLNEGTYEVGQSVKPGNYSMEIPAGTGSVSVLDAVGIPIYNEMIVEGQNNNQSQKINLELKVGDTININGVNGVKLTPNN
ncbi:hypothetical protein [Clostridium sp.]|uniref:hypothetical protein n=1 Tax=Clostridium sp. TaxID=1506 RepID=UPI003990E0FD